MSRLGIAKIVVILQAHCTGGTFNGRDLTGSWHCSCGASGKVEAPAGSTLHDRLAALSVPANHHLAEVLAAAIDLAGRTVDVDPLGADELAVEYHRRGTELLLAVGEHRRAMHWRVERSLVTVMLAGAKLRVIEAGSYELHGHPVVVVDDEGDLDGDAPTFELVVS